MSACIHKRVTLWMATSRTEPLVFDSWEPSKFILPSIAACSEPSNKNKTAPNGSKPSLNTDPSPVLFVFMFSCHWCGFSTPEQAQGLSHRKVSVVLLSQHHHSPCAFCVCACMHVYVCAHTDLYLAESTIFPKALHIDVCLSVLFVTCAIHACSSESLFHHTHQGFCCVEYILKLFSPQI